MNEETIIAIIFGYNLALIALTCYMAVNFSPWWVLLLILTQFKVSFKNDSNDQKN